MIVYFSQFDLVYWGMRGSSENLAAYGSDEKMIASAFYDGGYWVDLRIKCVGDSLYFQFKHPDNLEWTTAGRKYIPNKPKEIGLSAKSWKAGEYIFDFDYLKVFTPEKVKMHTTKLKWIYQNAKTELPLYAQGGTQPYEWRIVDGELSEGLTLTTDGILSGTPTVVETDTFTVAVFDNSNPPRSDSTIFMLEIAGFNRFRLDTKTLETAWVDQLYYMPVQAKGGIKPYRWSVVSGDLSDGLDLDSSTGVLSGMPVEPGETTFSIAVNDCQNPVGGDTLEYTLSIQRVPPIDEEFMTGSLHQYDISVPVAGPAIEAYEGDGYMHMRGPSTDVYDHWTHVSDAPCVLRPCEEGDWEVETSLLLYNYDGDHFQTGLCVYFSEYDMLYWGFAGGDREINLSRSGRGILLKSEYVRGIALQLRICKQGKSYYFSYKAPWEGRWTEVGRVSIGYKPLKVGTIIKTWDKVNVHTAFDYLRLGSSTVHLLLPHLPNGYLNSPLHLQLGAYGGEPPYNWEILKGSLPAGLALSHSGEITGTPTGLETQSFSVQVTDNSTPPTMDSTEYSLQITDIPPLKIDSTSIGDAIIDEKFNVRLTASGGIPPYKWSIQSGELPEGLALHPYRGTIEGVPADTVQTEIVVAVTDKQNPVVADTMSLTINVVTAPVIDEEFTTGRLDDYVVYIPQEGPAVEVFDDGWLQIDLPGNRPFDHWRNKDDAPQLRRTCDSTDWCAQTRVNIAMNQKKKFHAGIGVVFDQYDMLYWGFMDSDRKLNYNYTGTLNKQNTYIDGGTPVELQIKKEGNVYHLSYRIPDSDWQKVGSFASEKTPRHICLFCKSWQLNAVKVRFDYLRYASEPKELNKEQKQTGKTEKLPEKFSLSKFYPNPFNPVTRINMDLVAESKVKFTVYNILGQRVKTMDWGKLQPGRYKLVWNGTDQTDYWVQTGVYFIRVQVNDRVYHRKVLLLK